MKKLLPVALLLCLSCSLSGFTPVRPAAKTTGKVKPNVLVTWPITGTVPSLPSYTYSISGGGNTPNAVTIWNNNVLVGTYPFSVETVGSTYTSYVADDMYVPTGTFISAFQLIVYNSGSYVLNIISV
jgi:hypothetical protein